MNRWDDEEAEAGAPPFKPLTREEALALRAKEPPLSPWWVTVSYTHLTLPTNREV